MKIAIAALLTVFCTPVIASHPVMDMGGRALSAEENWSPRVGGVTEPSFGKFEVYTKVWFHDESVQMLFIVDGETDKVVDQARMASDATYYDQALACQSHDGSKQAVAVRTTSSAGIQAWFVSEQGKLSPITDTSQIHCEEPVDPRAED